MPCYSAGTGAYNVDRLYQFGDTGAAVYREDWQKVDIDSWQETVEDLLPSGLQIWKGVDYDLENPWSGLVARTPLWKSDDGNCCPSGGNAVISFEIVDSVLVVIGVVATPPQSQP